jgi:CMP-2-keto-3-deoxyoctulosonic acid synthetase
MQESNSYLAIIPARKGSKGIPGKNLKKIGGKPMIQFTIEAAISSEPACLINHSADLLHSRISLTPFLLAMLFNEHEDTTQVSNKN